MLVALDQSGAGLRAVALVNALGISRDSLRSVLGLLTEHGLVMRNPGYGHPLRPEYILTDRGSKVASACQQYPGLAAGVPVLRRKWPAPVLLMIRQGSVRFNGLVARLGVTPRALTQTLRCLERSALIHRHIDDGYPPRTSYSLTDEGHRIAEQVRLIEISLTA